jgi:mannose/fructose/N-acetylgalactosamine-specific phosphotransferase system component IID
MLKDYLLTYVRVFFVQSLWNFERQQNVGLLFLIKPFLEKFYKDPKERREAFLRHTEFFNTHPYMAGIVAASVIKAENEISAGNKALVSTMTQMKQSMASPLAAIGDSFFSGTLKTTIALASIFLTILFSLIDPMHLGEFGILFPLMFIVLFNVFHLAGQYVIILAAFVLGREFLLALSKPNFRLALMIVSWIGLVLAVASTIIYIFYIKELALFSIYRVANITIIIWLFALSLIFARGQIGVKIIITVLFCIVLEYIRN